MNGRTDGPIGHLAGIGLLTLVLLWPALWSGAPTAFIDSENYYNGGGEAVRFFLDRTGLNDLLAPGSTDGSSAADTSAVEAEKPAGAANSVRSVPYSVFLNLTIRALGPMAAVIPMALVTAWLIWLMMAPLRPSLRLAAGTLTALATTLPFYAAQLMPDIQAAWLIAIPIVVMRRGGRLGRSLAIALLLAATAAILFHYSHIPLAAATGVVLGLWFLWRRRLAAALLAQLPLALAIAVNLAISVVISHGGGAETSRGGGAEPAGEESPAAERSSAGVSIAPGRLPVLLARLLEDGVAIRYLSETCPENGFTICRVYDRFPDTSREALWGENNIRTRASPEQMRQISAEEMSLAWEVILYDPWGQIRASVENTADQLIRFGLEDLHFARYEIAGPEEIHVDPERAPPGLFPVVEKIQVVSVTLAALALLALVWRVPAARAPVALLAVGLLANAFVCGALSAPAGRYQGRVVWLVVATALAFGASWPKPGRASR